VISRSPIACSGLMYCGVPRDIPVSVIRPPTARLAASAIPKSATSARPSWNSTFARLDVAMNDAVAVRVVERGSNLSRDSNRISNPELLLAIEPVAECFSFDVRHHVRRGTNPLRRNRRAAECWGGSDSP